MSFYTLTPQKIAELTHGKYIGKYKQRNNPVTGAARDNRDIVPGNLFVCIRGEHTDGHLYANRAFDAGAACCLAEIEIPDAKGSYVLVDSTLEAIKTIAAYHRNQFQIPIIGITGSTGKTTTKELVASALKAGLCVHKTQKNLNNELGVPLTLLALREEHEAAVIEMGISDFGEMSRLAQMVRPDIFIITNIGYSHTKELKDLNGVLRAKTEAFQFMNPEGTAILNGDDQLLWGYNPGIRKILFGQSSYNQYRAENINAQSISSVKMDIVSSRGVLPVDIPAYGCHLAQLAPAAVAVGHLLDLSDEEIRCGLSLYVQMEGRSNISVINGITLIDDSYNANPGSVKSALLSLSSLPGRHIAILGDMLNLGQFSKELHYDIGQAAAECNIDALLCHGEEAKHIIDGYITAGGKEAKHYGKMELLVRSILGKIKKGDAILVKASHGMRFDKLLPIISEVISDL